MSKLIKGTNVVVVDDNELKNGNVRDVYDVIGIAIVDFGDGVYKKVPLDQIAIAPEKETPSEVVQKSEITITSDEFVETCAKIIADKSQQFDSAIVMILTVAYADLHATLFIEDPEND